MSYFDTNRGRERYLGARARALGVPPATRHPGLRPFGRPGCGPPGRLAAWTPWTYLSCTVVLNSRYQVPGVPYLPTYLVPGRYLVENAFWYQWYRGTMLLSLKRACFSRLPGSAFAACLPVRLSSSRTLGRYPAFATGAVVKAHRFIHNRRNEAVQHSRNDRRTDVLLELVRLHVCEA